MRTRLIVGGVVGGLVLLLAIGAVVLLTGGGDKDDPGSDGPSTAAGGYPTDAAEADFCTAVNKVSDATAGAFGEGELTESEWGDIQDAFADFGRVGTPTGVSAAQRRGFVAAVEAFAALDYDGAKDYFAQENTGYLPGSPSDADAQDAEAFFDFMVDTCSDQDLG